MTDQQIADLGPAFLRTPLTLYAALAAMFLGVFFLVGTAVAGLRGRGGVAGKLSIYTLGGRSGPSPQTVPDDGRNPVARADVLRLYRHVEVHAGLLIIIPAVPKEDQQLLLGIALDAIAARNFDMVNQLCEIDVAGVVEFSAWPFDTNA